MLVHKCTTISSNPRVSNQGQSQVTTVTWTRSIVHYDGVVDASVQWDVRITTTECWSSTHQQSAGALRTTHCSLGKMETTLIYARVYSYTAVCVPVVMHCGD